MIHQSYVRPGNFDRSRDRQNYARFLNDATERLFLQRIGRRDRFIHKLLQEHFAKIEL